jgi:hypothetical protein
VSKREAVLFGSSVAAASSAKGTGRGDSRTASSNEAARSTAWVPDGDAMARLLFHDVKPSFHESL